MTGRGVLLVVGDATPSADRLPWDATSIGTRLLLDWSGLSPDTFLRLTLRANLCRWPPEKWDRMAAASGLRRLLADPWVAEAVGVLLVGRRVVEAFPWGPRQAPLYEWTDRPITADRVLPVAGIPHPIGQADYWSVPAHRQLCGEFVAAAFRSIEAGRSPGTLEPGPAPSPN